MASTVRLRFHPYMRGESQWHEVPAMVRGDIAVHRPAHITPEGDLSPYRKAWTVSHIPTGERIESALPARFRDRGAITATQRELLAWAEALQLAFPLFFELAREDPQAAVTQYGQALLDTGRAL